jgi:hypothetical protein
MSGNWDKFIEKWTFQAEYFTSEFVDRVRGNPAKMSVVFFPDVNLPARVIIPFGPGDEVNRPIAEGFNHARLLFYFDQCHNHPHSLIFAVRMSRRTWVTRQKTGGQYSNRYKESYRHLTPNGPGSRGPRQLQPWFEQPVVAGSRASVS